MKSWSSRLMVTAAGLAGVVLLSVATVGGTLAMWTAQAGVPDATISAGNANLAVEAPVGLDTTQLFPGQSVTAPFSVHNPGTVPLAPRVDVLTWSDPAALADAVTIQVWADTGVDCESPAVGVVWSSAAPITGDLGVTVAPDTTQPMCLSATLSPSAPSSVQGAAADLQLTLEGVQQR